MMSFNVTEINRPSSYIVKDEGIAAAIYWQPHSRVAILGR
jgi:hypothetical protein